MTNMLSASGGASPPLPPDQGLCPWAPLRALPQTPVIGSCSALAMVPPTPSVAYDPRASSPPLILTSLRLYDWAPEILYCIVLHFALRNDYCSACTRRYLELKITLSNFGIL